MIVMSLSIVHPTPSLLNDKNQLLKCIIIIDRLTIILVVILIFFSPTELVPGGRGEWRVYLYIDQLWVYVDATDEQRLSILGIHRILI